jgi:hypothetical protein
MGVEFGDGIAAEPGICEEFYEASIYLRGFLFCFHPGLRKREFNEGEI